MSYALFGPGGNGDWFRADGMKNALQTPGWLESKGIDAFEYEATRGVNASEEALRAFGTKVREHGISVSLHASYFISLSSTEAEKRQNSVRYIVQATRAAEWIGAHTIVIHSGSTAKMPRAEAMALSVNTLEMALEAVGDTPVKLGIETMGKLNQLGTLEEVIAQCRIAPGRLVPVVDFGHLNCREQGKAFPDRDAYRRVFDTIGSDLGDEIARNLHCHFSKIEYTGAGEKRHLTFEDDPQSFGPLPEPFCEMLAREGLTPTVICESAGTQAEDALYMKKLYRSAMGEDVSSYTERKI
jgi:deoxyribonuclease-4